MAEQSKRGGNKNKIIGICCGVAVVVLLVIAIVVAVVANSGYNDAYFESDGSKYVLTIDNTEELGEGEEIDDSIPVKTHYVYYYNGDNITDVKLFSEYASEDAAKAAYDELINSGEDVESSYKSLELNGKYRILTFLSTDYEGLTASDVKEQIEMINGMNESGDESTDGGTTEETTDGAEENVEK